MPIHIPTIINELRENATEEQRKGLSILDNRFYECIELKKKLDIAVKALEDIRTAYQFSGACGDGYEMDAIAEQALKEIDLVGTSVSLAKEEV